jgi:hydroxymethylpyrimidine pyrophosphatase-like HAD family hydrolase
MAVGDNFNDLDMLEYAGQPVLMENYCEGLARNGWPVTSSNDHDGLAVAIHTYILNQPA